MALVAAAGWPARAADTLIHETKLSNGLTIITKEVRVAPVVSVNVFYKVGSRNETTGMTGISHLLEHMMFKGSTHFPNGRMEELLRERGAINNAATWTDYTYYWELLQSDYLDLALKLEAGRMEGALIAPASLKSEMVVVRSELEGRENSPDSRLWDLVNATAFLAHPYHWPVIGWRSDVEGITRDEIYHYYRTHYGPNNATVVLVGDFNTTKAIALVKDYFGALKPVPSSQEPRTVEPEQHGDRNVDLTLAGTAQRIILAWPTPAAKNPDNYALDVLEQILSGGRSSRLYQALVEKGLATDAWAFNNSRIDPSLFYVGATAQQGKTNDELEAALMEQINRIKAQPPTEEELARAKRQIEASFVFTNDDVSREAQLIGRFALTVGVKKLAEYLPSIRQVTAADVQRVANKYLVPGKRTAGRFVPSGPPRPGAGGAPPGGPLHLFRDHWSDAFWPHYRAASYASALPAKTKPVAKTKKALQNQPRKTAPSTGLKKAVPVRKPAPRATPKRYVLKNGIVLIVLRNPANPSISISGSLNAGSWLDTPGHRGVAALTADMLERGTKTTSSLQFASAVDDLGASLSFDSGIESTSIRGKCLSRDFTRWMGLMADAIRHPAFSEGELEKLKLEKLSELEQEQEDPDSVTQRAFLNRIYPDGHPYHPGTLDEEKQGYKSVAREDLQQFHHNYYGPRGMILAVVGDINPDACRAAVEDVLGDWREQPKYAPVSIPDVATGSVSTSFILMPDKAETTVVYGWPGGLKRSSPDYYAAVVMNEILGGGSVLTSRLGMAIRVRMGLVYDVSSYFQASLGAGPWMATLAANPKNAEKAIKELRVIVEAMRRDGPTAKEVSDSERFITGVSTLRLATNEGIASLLRSAQFYGLGIDYLNRYRSLYGGVTLSEAKQAARKYLHPDSATLIIAGPQEVHVDGHTGGKR